MTRADDGHVTRTTEGHVVVSVDAMGGDGGPAPIVAGMAIAAKQNPDLRFIVSGDEAELRQLLHRRADLAARSELRHAEGVVTMDEKPSHVMRHGKGTSMWSAIEAVRDGDASVCVSCGNTGALMALSMVRLRKLAGVNRPAIACLWPSRNPGGFNVMLDAGADIRADSEDLLQYALMGVSYARIGLGVDAPRVGLLNVGTEEHKGRAELKVAHDMIAEAANLADFDFVGYVEGGDMPSSRVDVIVTDGFTGNVALKTGEGTASLIREFSAARRSHTPRSRASPLCWRYTSMRRLEKTDRSAAGQWRRVPRPQRQRREVPRIRRCHRRLPPR